VDLAKRSTTRKRGLYLEYPLCRTDRCALGRAIFGALGPGCAAVVREGNREDMPQGLVALAKLDRERLTCAVPTIDSFLRKER
jgi:hypothetical protein